MFLNFTEIESASGTTSLGFGSKIIDNETNLGNAREDIIACFGKKNRAYLFTVYITNDYGAHKASATNIELHRLLATEQELITSEIRKTGWRASFFSKYIILSQVIPTKNSLKDIQRFKTAHHEDDIIIQEIRVSSANYSFREKLDSTIKNLNEIFKELFFKYKISFKLTLFEAPDYNSHFKPWNFRVILNEHLHHAYYYLSVASKINNSINPVDVYDLQNIILNLKNKYKKTNDPGLCELLAEALYTPTLAVDSRKILYSSSYTNKKLKLHEFQSINQKIETLEMVSKRLIYDHKFDKLYNRWLFDELILDNIEHLYNFYFVYSDIHNIALGGTFFYSKNKAKTHGNKKSIIKLVYKFLEKSMGISELLQNAYLLKHQGEAYINDYYSFLSVHKILLNKEEIPSFYVDVGDQVQGIVKKPEDAVLAFEIASKNIGYKFRSGLGIVKITPEINFSTIAHRAEFCVQVTKLFKGTHPKWDVLQIWGERFSSIKANAALKLIIIRMKNKSNLSFLLEIIRFQEEWLMHIPGSLHHKFVSAFENITELATNRSKNASEY